ncbi:MAG: HEAT repeat domain-containing protein [Spirochaetota bacterium]|jgi:HEAT repeat protein|nr:HEAT repeat domain-containing protein [Spirochaetota bacterium]
MKRIARLIFSFITVCGGLFVYGCFLSVIAPQIIYGEDMADDTWRPNRAAAANTATGSSARGASSAAQISSRASAAANTPTTQQIEFWRDTMLFGTPLQKEDALKAMQNFRAREVDAILLESLPREAEGANQRRIIQLLHERQVAGALRPLEEALQKAETPETKGSAIGALAKFKDKSSLPIILTYVTNSDTMIQQEAIRAIGMIGDPAPAAQLLEMLDSLPSSADLRHDLVNALGELKYAPAYDSLRACAMNAANGRYLRAFAITALGKIADKRIIPDFLKLLNEEKMPELKLRVVAAFGEMPTAETIPAIQSAMADGDETVRIAAIRAAGRTRDKELAKAVLYRFRYDNEARVMLASAEALQEIGQPDLPALIMQRFESARDTAIMSGFVGILKKCPPQPQAAGILRKKQDENKFSKLKDEIQDLLNLWGIGEAPAAARPEQTRVSSAQASSQPQIPNRVFITE